MSEILNHLDVISKLGIRPVGITEPVTSIKNLQLQTKDVDEAFSTLKTQNDTIISKFLNVKSTNKSSKFIIEDPNSNIVDINEQTVNIKLDKPIVIDQPTALILTLNVFVTTPKKDIAFCTIKDANIISNFLILSSNDTTRLVFYMFANSTIDTISVEFFTFTLDTPMIDIVAFDVEKQEKANIPVRNGKKLKNCTSLFWYGNDKNYEITPKNLIIAPRSRLYSTFNFLPFGLFFDSPPIVFGLNDISDQDFSSLSTSDNFEVFKVKNSKKITFTTQKTNYIDIIKNMDKLGFDQYSNIIYPDITGIIKNMKQFYKKKVKETFAKNLIEDFIADDENDKYDPDSFELYKSCVLKFYNTYKIVAKKTNSILNENFISKTIDEIMMDNLTEEAIIDKFMLHLSIKNFKSGLEIENDVITELNNKYKFYYMLADILANNQIDLTALKAINNNKRKADDAEEAPATKKLAE